MKVAVVGAGPSGLFFGHRLLRLDPGIRLSYYESRPLPFGLVRFGVAPDHPEVKNCTRILESVLERETVTCRYGVSVGSQATKVTLSELLGHHNAVVLATGLSKPRELQVGHRSLSNYFTSAEFVAWYNNDPAFGSLNIDLRRVKKVAVIGHGNVTLDIARMLLKPWWSYSDTAISDRALRALQQSAVEQVDLIGRRGPLQVSFTRAELKEILDLQGIAFKTDLNTIQAELQKCGTLLDNDRPRRRLFELFQAGHWQANPSGPKVLGLDFYQSPREVTGTFSVSGLWLEHTRPTNGTYRSTNDIKGAPIEGTGALEHRQYQLIISSAGFENHCTFGLPTNGQNGPIHNVDGRVAGFQNLFVTGWAATGAIGDLSSTMRHSHSVAELVYHFLHNLDTE